MNAYKITLPDTNAKLQALLAEHGRPENEADTVFLCWLSHEDLTRITSRYDGLLVQPIVSQPDSAGQLEQFSVRIPAELEVFAQRLGEGNRSAGVTKALQFAKSLGLKPAKAKAKTTPK